IMAEGTMYSGIIPLKDFPRLPNGKINHKALPQPTALSTTTNTDYAPPQGALEEQLTQIWEATLAHRPIGRQDNFFAIGGDSILSIQIVAKAREAGIDLAPDQLFDHQTIADLARSVTQSAAASQLVEVDLPKINRYPLSHLQQAFLFNSQQEGEDQGILHLTFYLEGSIDEALFQKAWALCMQRHDAMRSYVDRSEKGLAVQVIAESADLTWTTIDWRELSGSAREEALQKLQNETQAALSLSEAPVSQLQLIQLDQEEYLLHWTCHHLFLDGWSCGLILKDALQYYDALYQGKSLSLKALPNYLNYLDWRAQQDTEEAQAFWQKQLAGLSEVLHFPVRAQTSAFVDLQSVIDQETTQRLMAYCQEGQVSLSTLFQGIWVLLLGRRFDHQEVVFGKTVSGRFNAFPQIDAISGLFMNVVPDRIAIPAQTTFGNWLQSLQKAQGQKNKYDHIPQEQIQQWSQWPSTIDLFESLFLFGNFLQEQSAIGPIAIKRFEGGFSSTYPLTIRIKPGQQILINWRYDQQRVDDDTLQWFNEQLLAFCRALQSNTLAQNLESLWQHIPMPFAPLPTRNISDLGPAITPEAQHYVPPRTLLEQQLCTIWEELFQRQPIGIEDHFFDLGGRSMLALQLFARIEQEMGEVLPPATLFQHPTIAGLARMMNQDGKEGSSVLVPLRAQGEQQPLFCLHGGGAHVFFYQALTKYLPAELPVYSIQPPGLDGNREFHQSIEEMAAEYIQEIKTVQAQGPYRILGTCFSNAVALEMARQLEAAGEKIDPLLIIDSGPLHLFGDDPQGKSKTLRRFYDLVKHGDLSRIKRKIANRLMAKKAAVPQTPVEAESSSGRHLRLMIESLNKLYAQYHWQPIEGAIHFIRSTEFEQREDKQYQVGQWTKLAKGGLSIAVVQGHHKTLFEEPEVQGLSEQVADYLVG
ncbi:MAG: condensation domain-containing protein, partial [Bacteroidota bacterium]